MYDYQRRHCEDAKKAYAALMKVYPLTLDDLPGEIWKPIPDFDKYEVSNFGRVKSLQERWRKPRILKPATNYKGYLLVQLCINGKGKNFRVHRLVALAFIPNPEGKPEINHRDGCRLNNFVGNLEWVTSSENQRHAYLTGLQVAMQGEKHANAKLTNQQVLYIKENPLDLTNVKLAEMFSVDSATISLIQRGKRWKQVEGAVRPKRHIPDDVRNQIRAEYVFGSHEFGSRALAKKYGVGQGTILRIIRET